MKEALVVSTRVPGVVVALRGRVDVHTVSKARDALHAAVDAGSGTMVLEFSGVDLLDAAGLGMLAGTQRRAERAGRRLVLRGTPSRLRRLLRATRLDRILPTVDPEPAPAAATATAPAPAAATVTATCEVSVPSPRRALTAALRDAC
ncbi:MAG: STAS domain-containing protein [Micromonosporaceae bacterium]